MKIESKDFRVREGDKVNLEKWPTKVDPVYKSKEQYKSLLEDHVAKLSAMQEAYPVNSGSPVYGVGNALDLPTLLLGLSRFMRSQ